jgi:heptosyltransferase-2
MRTGVIQPLPGIGDMIWYLPALRAIAGAAPDQAVILFTRDSVQAKSLFSVEPMIAEVINLPRKRRGFLSALPNFFLTWRMLRSARPDRLFILHQSSRYRFAARLAGIKDIITYPRELAYSKANGWEKSLSFLKHIGLAPASPYSQLSADPALIELMKRHYHDHPKPWMIVMPGASDSSRLWPADRFSFCINQLLQKTQGTLFLVGRQNEAEHLSKIQRLSAHKDKIIMLTNMSFDHVMGLISCCDFLLGNDSGPANAAAALGRPAFALCGISEPPVHSPNLHLIRPDLSTDQAAGMERISATHVMTVLREYLEKA